MQCAVLLTWCVDFSMPGYTTQQAPKVTSILSLADPYAAVFKAGHDYAYPEIPEDLSEACKQFILLCFIRNPEERATAARLLEDPFLEQ
ncbi:unnamed protein product [Dibothriocephalus latus]|uniref:Protein kinase domain-containing protein n=1 Tax=Dibothriocephalus latus TaxID=60516 RepID=A0A3P7P5H4_DIBLA|nr:unnamed protein product [Dibothriocephalus latus]